MELQEETLGLFKNPSPPFPFLPDGLHIPLGFGPWAPFYGDQLTASEVLLVFH